MSEVIVVNPGSSSTAPVLGLNIINEARLQVSRETPTSPVVTEGSTGRDSIRVISPRDSGVFQLSGGEDQDDIAGAAGDDLLSGDDGNDFTLGRAGNDQISGGEGSDFVSGGTGNDRVQGNAGIDLVDAGAGDDIVDGGDGNDTLLGGPGNDQLFGGNNEDVLRGGAGNDELYGGANGDDLRGGSGEDLLVPGTGIDILRGGTGSDTFRFTAGATGQGQLDRINDFSPTQDTIELSRALLPASNLQQGALSSEDFAIVKDIGAGDITATLIYEQKSGIVYYNPDNGRSVPLFQMQSNLNAISAENFTIL